MKRRFTVDDALVASEALGEVSTGHEEAATAVLDAGRLDGLTSEDLQELRPVRRRGLGL